jgi:hypothetical protein
LEQWLTTPCDVIGLSAQTLTSALCGKPATAWPKAVLGRFSVALFHLLLEHIHTPQARRHCAHYSQRKERGFLDHKKEMFFANRDDRTIGFSDGGCASAALIDQSHSTEEAVWTHYLGSSPSR